MITFARLVTLFPLTIKEEVALQHIKRAANDVKDVDFGADEDTELEVVGSKAMYYIAPLLWVDMQNRVSEYEESLQTFKDIERFQEYWLNRSSSALLAFQSKDGENTSKSGGLQWATP